MMFSIFIICPFYIFSFIIIILIIPIPLNYLPSCSYLRSFSHQEKYPLQHTKIVLIKKNLKNFISILCCSLTLWQFSFFKSPQLDFFLTYNFLNQKYAYGKYWSFVRINDWRFVSSWSTYQILDPTHKKKPQSEVKGHGFR